ncbi:hypothetical protein PC9H_004100 [Pleurotus ostreatus]|uniref:FYVE-type domain-containing protein n=1 Tax=Pleurotus ostreatus TaxID=5322 RepID=A0A8H6ZZM4_PLEOS|nr:uncharacterized protein PC9H_004100 [Pleurotus ostreatus]KAF7437263.1 hypothetical protein PC9H_004100 [Pleurotus ostreatus]KAJ8703151.1 hypothetical protein PTI98_001800 [Pleurotus ostreatus]
MSALTVSLAAYDAQHPPSPPSAVLPTLPVLDDIDADAASPPPSSSPSSSQLSTLTASTSSSSADSSTSSSSSMDLRANEHLAVLLPKHLWKEDALASACDNFYCRVRFSIFERRHHCRKCGSVFCAACTSHTTALLDTSSPFLPFTHPPHRTPIAVYASKDSPVVENARVCTACFDQIHGIPQRQRTPELVKSVKGKPSISSLTSSSSRSSASSSASADAPATPTSPSLSPSPSLAPSPPTPHTRTRTRSKRRISLLTSTQPTLPADVLAALSSLSQHPHHTVRALNTPNTGRGSGAVSPASEDPLSVYPLTRHSAVCKAMGGGRWTPTPSSPSHTSPLSPLHSPSPLHTSPLHSPLGHPAWSEKAERRGYFDLGEIVSDEAGFRYRRVLHVQMREEVEAEEGVRPF